MEKTAASWSEALAEEKQQPYFQQLWQRVQQARANGDTIYPANDDVFNALIQTPLPEVKVVILGQDPYHGPQQAHGLSFSVKPGVAIPPSLRNMYKALQHDYPDFQIPQHGCLTAWAEQGVLLLNTVLTVAAGQAHSHAAWGWERFTDAVIRTVNERCQGVVFLLWGSHAKKKAQLIDANRHHVLTAVHPSPLSAHRGFFECGHFRRTNELLTSQQKKPIDWQLPLTC